MEANHIGRESEIQAIGSTWKVGRWTRAVWADWLDWAKTQLPDPLAIVKKDLETWPKEVQEYLVRQALDRATRALSIGSPEVSLLLDSPEGSCRLLYHLLKKNHPDVTEDDAMDILFEVGQEELKKRFDKAAGTPPPAPNA